MQVLNGPLIKEFIDREGYQRKWLAKRLGVSVPMVSVLLEGRMPSDMEIVEKLQKIIGCPFCELVADVKFPKGRS